MPSHLNLIDFPFLTANAFKKVNEYIAQENPSPIHIGTQHV